MRNIIPFEEFVETHTLKEVVAAIGNILFESKGEVEVIISRLNRNPNYTLTQHQVHVLSAWTSMCYILLTKYVEEENEKKQPNN